MTGLMRAAQLEALTLLAHFCVAMPLKYLADVPQAVFLVGPVHGLAFILFVWFVIRAWSEGLVGPSGALRLVAGAFIPFGGFVCERWLRSQKKVT